MRRRRGHGRVFSARMLCVHPKVRTLLLQGEELCAAIAIPSKVYTHERAIQRIEQGI